MKDGNSNSHKLTYEEADEIIKQVPKLGTFIEKLLHFSGYAKFSTIHIVARPPQSYEYSDIWRFTIIFHTPIFLIIKDSDVQKLVISYSQVVNSRELKDDRFIEYFINRVDNEIFKEYKKLILSNNMITQYNMIASPEKICYYWEWEHFGV